MKNQICEQKVETKTMRLLTEVEIKDVSGGHHHNSKPIITRVPVGTWTGGNTGRVVVIGHG